ncbi:hypothetical protein L539_3626 [Bordetella hinzii 5132]|uniref:hypothetical protein n=1 Tax=Bordetella hinzii TaxID=103855 RepID=UPI00045A8B03|nr:hypothetical protein [Bordetella hinzii]KCB41265.1 hypothetical protein L539_3626 [Bordetella hinzii 5132]
MNILDQKAESHEQALWLVSNPDGTREIVTTAEQAGRGGFAPPWGLPYRQVLADILKSVESSTAHWLKFHEAYLRGEAPTESPLGGRRTLPAIHFVAGAHTYTAYIGTHYKGNFLGFGGARVTITMADGKVYESNNLWSGRDVPPDLRGILKDNATIKWH